MSTATVTLSAYCTNFDNAADWDAWVDFVCDNIDDACGFEVDVATFPMFRCPELDEVVAPDADSEQTIKDAIQRLWDDFCSGPVEN